MATTFGPNYTNNQYIINNQIVSGATLLASSFQTVLGDLNLMGYTIGASLGNYASFSAPFSQQDTIIGNIVAGYSAAVALLGNTSTSGDVGGIIYKYKNLGGF
jgi:hypothetical protein